MKRFFIVTFLVVLAISSSGCRYGLFGRLRGARCAPAPAPTPTPLYYGYPTVPSTQCCPPAPVCPCPTTSYTPGYSIDATPGTIPPSQGFQEVPSLDTQSQQTFPGDLSVPGGPAFSQVIGDRKLDSGEPLPISMPVSSASQQLGN